MSKRLYPHKRVRYWYVYDIDDICTLYSDYTLHAQTIRQWVKNGLKTIDTGKPMLIYGANLIAYLKENNSKHKCKTSFDQFYCMGCHDARYIYQNAIAVKQQANFLQVQARCRECKKTMFKSYKIIDFSDLKKTFRLVDVSQLYDVSASTSKTHIPTPVQKQISESSQGELFL